MYCLCLNGAEGVPGSCRPKLNDSAHWLVACCYMPSPRSVCHLAKPLTSHDSTVQSHTNICQPLQPVAGAPSELLCKPIYGARWRSSPAQSYAMMVHPHRQCSEAGGERELVKVEQGDHLSAGLCLIAGLQEQPAVMEGKTNDLFDVGHDLAVAYPANQLGRSGWQASKSARETAG